MTSKSQELEARSVPTALHSWDRQKGESLLAYRLFSVFRDMGISRTTKEAAEALGRSHPTVKRLSIENQWMLRANAYDEFKNDETERELRYEITEARRRHHRLGELMLGFAAESIENLRAMGDLLSVKDVVMLTEAGHKIESTALGMANEITESRVAADVHVRKTEEIPVAILERIGKEIASAKSAGEDTSAIEAEFEDLSSSSLLVDGDGNGNGEKVPVAIGV